MWFLRNLKLISLLLRLILWLFWLLHQLDDT